MNERDEINASVYVRGDGHWMLAFRHGALVEHVDLNRLHGRPIGGLLTAEVVAEQWLSKTGALHVECPTCGARRGVVCKVGTWKAGRPNRPEPHARRLEQVQLNNHGEPDGNPGDEDRPLTRVGELRRSE